MRATAPEIYHFTNRRQSPSSRKSGRFRKACAMTSKLLQDLNPRARDLPPSGIVELINAGRLKSGLIPLWVGEGHLPTPDFICKAATQSMAAGETFYTWQRGIPELRQALADYHNQHFGREFSPEQFFVTGSGMQSIQLALQALVRPGDEVLIPTPAWPNFEASARVAGAQVVEVAMRPPNLETGEGWKLDLNHLEAAITPKSRVLFINSPSNPTGWSAKRAELQALVEMARRYNLWIVADEVYHRFYFGEHSIQDRAPSFYDVMEEEDKIIFTNTFSKNWAMTGWRVGWISASRHLGQVFESLIQFSTSGVAVFMQRAAVEALKSGEDFIAAQVETATRSRAILCNALAATERVNFAIPEGAFYLFFSIRGMNDTKNLALRLIDEALLGLAPGSAFGKGGETYLRLCFARKPEDIEIASERLSAWLKKH